MPDFPPANGYGCVLTADGALKIDWIQRPIAPDAVLELLAYHCKRKCTRGMSLSAQWLALHLRVSVADL